MFSTSGDFLSTFGVLSKMGRGDTTAHVGDILSIYWRVLGHWRDIMSELGDNTIASENAHSTEGYDDSVENIIKTAGVQYIGGL